MMDLFYFLVGQDPQTITWWQMSIRAAITFFYILILIRLGSIRAFAKATSFDIVLAILMGTTLSRALTGNAPFLPTIAASAVLVFLHRLLAILAFHNQSIARLVKGKEISLIKNGDFDYEGMKKTSITSHDILEALRVRRGKTDFDSILEAYLERSGAISLIER